MEQTAVEYLIEQLSNYDSKMIELFGKEINKAKEMEKEQKCYSEEDLKQAFAYNNRLNMEKQRIIDAYRDSRYSLISKEEAEQYYNETFKNK